MKRQATTTDICPVGPECVFSEAKGEFVVPCLILPIISLRMQVLLDLKKNKQKTPQFLVLPQDISH